MSNISSFTDKKGRPRVVVTGTGVISPVGHNTKDFWTSLIEGRHGIVKLEMDDENEYKVKTAAPVKDFDPTLYMDRKEARRMDRYCQFAVAAAQEAVVDSGVDFSKMDPFDVGVIIGSGVGGLTTMYDQYEVLFCKGGNAYISVVHSDDDLQYSGRSGCDELRFKGRELLCDDSVRVGNSRDRRSFSRDQGRISSGGDLRRS